MPDGGLDLDVTRRVRTQLTELVQEQRLVARLERARSVTSVAISPG
jgi:hypothetical protein